MIDVMRPRDWEQVRAIYLEGVGTGNSTFETAAPEWSRWDSGHLPEHRFVMRDGDAILGWVALSPVSSRCVYSGVAELSIYVGGAHRGRGVGSALIEALVLSTEKAGIWTLQATIFPENAASLHLVGNHGFRRVGVHEKLGKMVYGQYAGTWRDVVLMERRSTVAGVD